MAHPLQYPSTARPTSLGLVQACASLLVALDVHPRLAMQILRHSQIAVTMDVYSQVTSDSTSRALSGSARNLKAVERRRHCCILLLTQA
jgi:hypothetical protein